jgi:hypothetical protein
LVQEYGSGNDLRIKKLPSILKIIMITPTIKLFTNERRRWNDEFRINYLAGIPGIITCDACGIKNKIIFLFDFWEKFIYLY